MSRSHYSQFSRWQRPRRTRELGTTAFTLLELMIVIVLIGIISAAILPAMRGTYEDALLRSTGRELMNVFELATSRAVSLNRIHRVRIDETTGRYLVESEAQDRAAETAFAPLRDVPGSEGTLDTRIAISIRYGSPDEENGEGERSSPNASAGPAVAEPVIAFYPDGTADAGEIRLQDREGFRLALRINPVTARVRIAEVPRE